jgi:hypothetical protein
MEERKKGGKKKEIEQIAQRIIFITLFLSEKFKIYGSYQNP